MTTHQVVLCHPVRTAIGTYGGGLKSMSATDLGATVIKAVLERSELDGAAVDSVVMGNVVQAGNKMNPARQCAVKGGVPVGVPALTVNRVCGSGAQTVASAASEIFAGMLDCALAGGTENMDMAGGVARIDAMVEKPTQENAWLALTAQNVSFAGLNSM